jgi:DUF2075 family protein
MIVYSSDKRGFLADMDMNSIEDKVLHLMKTKSRTVQANEVRSWKNSLPYMDRTLRGMTDVPDDAGISIEYHIPNCGKRIDFIITGLDENKKESVIIIEIKQWSKIEATSMPSTVRVQYEKGPGNSTHPSYQAWSYARLIQDYNETVQKEDIHLGPCAFLHNYTSDGVIDSPDFAADIEKAPLFLKEDIQKLRDFIKKHIKYGDTKNILYRIENGKIRPSKQLADHLVGLLKGNAEFVLIDEQKIAYETVLANVAKSSKDKNVIIIEGGPGTGKTVLAINLLVELTNRGKVAQYVSKNSAPREVYQAKLAGSFKKTQISSMFVGSGSFVDAKNGIFDALIIDEAHRLNQKSGMFKHLGENQVKELIQAAKTSIFFIDEDQRVTIFDIGTKKEIIKYAKEQGANVIEMDLPSQFRCNGSDGYLAWLDNLLQIRKTANYSVNELDYEFKVVDDPHTLFEMVTKKNKSNKARMVAGYCWGWPSKKDKKAFDIVIPEHNFKMKWNFAEDTMLWIMKDDSLDQIGCIHTCQGLELEYVGVIIGPDLIVRDGKIITDFKARAASDQSLKGLKGMAKKDLVKANCIADPIIRNTYRTLMTRGSKGCYVFCTDEETREYFKSCLGVSNSEYRVEKTKISIAADHKLKYTTKK